MISNDILIYSYICAYPNHHTRVYQGQFMEANVEAHSQTLQIEDLHWSVPLELRAEGTLQMVGRKKCTSQRGGGHQQNRANRNN